MTTPAPTVAPEMTPLKLVTMTLQAHIDTNLNLDVLACHTEIDDKITAINFRDTFRNSTDQKISYRSNSISGRFKNQCTFKVYAVDKIIDVKVFNNGKIVMAGCLHKYHAETTIDILRNIFVNMEGLVIYTIPDRLTCKNVKKFFKDELHKKFGELLQLLALELELHLNLEPFSSAQDPDEAYKMFMTELDEDPAYESELMYLCTVISILKCYYGDEITPRFNDPEFKYLLALISNNTNLEAGEISCEFPSYLNNKQVIPFDKSSIGTALINKSTNCGYFINRPSAVELLLHEPRVASVKYDKSRYPGVIIVYQTPTTVSKDVKIILFHTGKINITAAFTHEQVDEAYSFIKEFTARHFNNLLLKNEYFNKNKEYEDKLPTTFHVGLIDGKDYYLLKKVNITSNPRNVRFLNTHKLLDSYREHN